VLAVAAVVLFASGCEYRLLANEARDNGEPVPWFCNPTAPNSVNGPGMGTINWYAGVDREPLGYEDCGRVATMLDKAKAYAQQYPTLADAEAAGMRSTFAFLPGMGTHHGADPITPAQLVDPGFDPHDPVPDAVGIMDGVFDPATPEFLQYNGNGPTAQLIGMSYYVYTDTGLPPEGFPGDNDWWHHHPQLCLRKTNAQAFLVNTSDTACANAGGVNVHLSNWYMLHVWLVDDIEYYADVHAPTHPCILSSGAILDMDDPCHGSAGRAAARGAAAAEPAPFFCPIGMLGSDPAATLPEPT